MNTITAGVRVITPIGPGLTVGRESFYGGKLVRHLVRLDDPSRWAFGDRTDVAAFFERELVPVHRHDGHAVCEPVTFRN